MNDEYQHRESQRPKGLGLDLVYRTIPHKPEFIILAPRERAFYVHQIWQAVQQAKTWKQFAAMLPAAEWQSVIQRMDEKPCEGETFDAEMLPGYSDGDYPPWLQTEVARCLPAIVREEFALKRESCINGLYWEIPAELEVALIKRLRSLGHSVKREDNWFFY